MAEIFDVVKHKNGWTGVIRKIYFETDTYDVEVDNEYHNIVYNSPASNWTVVAPNEEGPLTYITKGDK